MHQIDTTVSLRDATPAPFKMTLWRWPKAVICFALPVELFNVEGVLVDERVVEVEVLAVDEVEDNLVVGLTWVEVEVRGVEDVVDCLRVVEVETLVVGGFEEEALEEEVVDGLPVIYS